MRDFPLAIDAQIIIAQLWQKNQSKTNLTKSRQRIFINYKKKLKPYFTFDAVMRAVAIFCLSLFLLLFKANEGAHAIVPTISQGSRVVKSTLDVKHQSHLHKHVNIHLQKRLSQKELNYAEEGKNEDESLAKKSLICVRAIYLYALLNGWHSIPQKHALPYCEHFSYTSSFKYLLLRVFRI